MAFQDITKVLYEGSIKLDYKDKAHRYYVRDRVDWTLPEEDAKAWSKTRRPKGTTTLLGDTLEKKGLMTWPMGMALRELFGFYNFTDENGEKKLGFSKEKAVGEGAQLIETGNLVGTLWKPGTKELIEADSDTLLPIIKSASENYLRKQKKGADIGSVVHDAIEHYITEQEFDIGETYMWNIKEAEYETEAARDLAMLEFEEDVKQAEMAFEQFKNWWGEKSPELVGAEELVYSKEHDVAGTFDGLIRIDGKLVLCDWKTSNAYKSAPQGVGYDYFIQSAIYAMAYMEMQRKTEKHGDTNLNVPDLTKNIDDLLIVSCRKDGGFDTVFASSLGLTVADCIDWAKAVITAYRMMDKTKAALIERAEPAKEAENA